MNTQGKEKKKPLTVMTLKQVVDNYLANHSEKESYVCIPNNKGGIGGTSVTYADNAGWGVDWDRGKLFIYPAEKMIERPPNFTDSQYQEALSRIKVLTNRLELLIDAVEKGDPKHLPNQVKHAKNILNILKKKEI